MVLRVKAAPRVNCGFAAAAKEIETMIGSASPMKNRQRRLALSLAE
jgi:hypothetical protein